MRNLLSDLRYAIRGLGRKPGFAAVGVLTLALGIGANSAMFSIVSGVLLQPLPYGEPDRLVFIWNQFPGAGENEMRVSAAELVDWREETEIFAGVGALTTGEQNLLWTLTADGRTERFSGAFTTVDLFEVLGVDAALGRTFLPEESTEGRNDVVILSDGFWRLRFGADPDIVGTRLTINGEDRTVVGVMSPGLNTNLNVSGAGPVDFWVAASFDPGQNRQWRFYNTVARLAPGATLEQAQAAVAGISRGFAEKFPEAYQDPGYAVALDPLHRRIVGDVRTPLLVLLGTVALVLLIAVSNVANLLLVRAESRQREIAVRTALGAGSGRVIQLLVVESLLLSAMGGIAGLVVAYGGVALLRSLNPGNIPRMDIVAIDARVLGFTLLLSVATGIVMGIVPGLHALKANINAALRDGGRGSTSGTRRNRMRRFLVISEVALAAVLVIGAGLFVKSFRHILDINLGIQTQSVLSMRMDYPPWQYPEIEQVAATHRQILERVEALPGVTSASLAHAEHPLRLNGRWYFVVDGRPVDPNETRPLVGIRVVSPDHMKTLGIPLISGRAFNEFDRLGSAPVILINHTMARKWFPEEDPIGARLRLWNTPDSTLFEIVGVVGDVKNEGIMEPVRENILLPLANPVFATGWQRHMTLMVRTPSDPTALAGTVRSAISDVDSRLTVYDIRPLDQVVSDAVAVPRFVTLLLGSFALLALILAAVGVYGVISYSVAQRTQELGVRIALGASRDSVLKLIIGQALTLALIGVGIGVAAALGVTRSLAGLLYGVSPVDPMTYVGVSLFLTLVAVIAAYLPARRASSIEPVVALRSE